jgi:hypothetical protein
MLEGSAPELALERQRAKNLLAVLLRIEGRKGVKRWRAHPEEAQHFDDVLDAHEVELAMTHNADKEKQNKLFTGRTAQRGGLGVISNIQAYMRSLGLEL